MTYATEKARLGREPVTVVELDLDTCSNTYGGALLSPQVGTCTAAGASGSECYNTRQTCQDTANYTRTTKTYRFCESRANLPVGIEMIPCLIEQPRFAPTKITPGAGIGQRGRVDITLQDFTHHDRGVDPYVDNRAYDPETQGTYWGKLLARTPYYHGRIMRVRSGYITDTWDWNNFESRTYVIESIDGPDQEGRVKIVGKDILKLAEDDRSQVPVASNGKLSADITSSDTSLTLTPSGIGNDEYPSSGTIRIGSEIMTFSGRSSDTLTGLTRAQYGTEADDHDQDDTVQLCTVWTDTNVVHVVYELLNTYAGIDTSYIPYNNGSPSFEWDTEKETWFSFQNVTNVISKPTGVRKVLDQLCQQFLINLWWDERDSEIKLKATAPSHLNQTLTEITDDYELLADSVSVEYDQDERISQVWVYWDKIDYSETDKEENYRQIYIVADLNKEGDDQYGSKKIKKIMSDWIGSLGQASQTAGRLIGRYKQAPIMVGFDLDAKDSSINTGDFIEITTRSIQDTDGSALTTKVQVIETSEDAQGHRFAHKALSLGFTERYAFVGPNTLNAYSSESSANKQAYAFIAPDSGQFSNGDDAYRMI